MLTLETERLILRDFLRQDWEALNAILSDPQVTRFMHFASWGEAERREWFEWLLQNASSQERDTYVWAVTLRESGVLIGWFGIETDSDLKEAAQGARSCGYTLNRQFWNTASARVMQKCGMIYEGTYDEDDSEGNRTSHHHYAITKQNMIC
jgi:ribosomal-protein-alanine N-acetyltransferase